MTILTCGLHDPKSGLRWTAERHLPVLFDIFDQVLMTASPETDPSFLLWLEEQGCLVHRRAGRLTVENYLDAIKQGVKTGADTIFYCDADRVLHWARTHPAELKRMAGKASKVDYFISMRGLREYASHHDALYYTEQLPNAIISAAMGEKTSHDYLAGCYSFSLEAATYVVRHIRAKDFSLFGEWPLRMKQAGFSPTYATCKGLAWETPDQHRDDVERCGNIEAYREWLSSPAEWKKRVKMANEFVRTII